MSRTENGCLALARGHPGLWGPFLMHWVSIENGHVDFGEAAPSPLGSATYWLPDGSATFALRKIRFLLKIFDCIIIIVHSFFKRF